MSQEHLNRQIQFERNHLDRLLRESKANISAQSSTSHLGLGPMSFFMSLGSLFSNARRREEYSNLQDSIEASRRRLGLLEGRLEALRRPQHVASLPLFTLAEEPHPGEDADESGDEASVASTAAFR